MRKRDEIHTEVTRASTLQFWKELGCSSLRAYVNETFDLNNFLRRSPQSAILLLFVWNLRCLYFFVLRTLTKYFVFAFGQNPLGDFWSLTKIPITAVSFRKTVKEGAEHTSGRCAVCLKNSWDLNWPRVRVSSVPATIFSAQFDSVSGHLLHLPAAKGHYTLSSPTEF